MISRLDGVDATPYRSSLEARELNAPAEKDMSNQRGYLVEHRWGQRVVVDIPIQIAASGSPCKSGRLSNSSITGALIKIDFKPRLLSLVVIVIGSGTSTDSDLKRITGYVSRVDRQGMGVEWCAMAASSAMDLVRLYSRPESRAIDHGERFA